MQSNSSTNTKRALFAWWNLLHLGQTKQHQWQAADADNPPDHSLQQSEYCPITSDRFVHMEHYWLSVLLTMQQHTITTFHILKIKHFIFQIKIVPRWTEVISWPWPDLRWPWKSYHRECLIDLNKTTIWFVAALCFIVDVRRTDVCADGQTFLPGLLGHLRRWSNKIG